MSRDFWNETQTQKSIIINNQETLDLGYVLALHYLWKTKLVNKLGILK